MSQGQGGRVLELYLLAAFPDYAEVRVLPPRPVDDATLLNLAVLSQATRFNSRHYDSARMLPLLEPAERLLTELTAAPALHRWRASMTYALALTAIGSQRLSENDTLRKSSRVLRQSLPLVPRDSAPRHFAATNRAIADSLLWLAARAGSPTLPLESAAAARAALEATSREQAPTSWALAQEQLSIALGEAASRERDRPELATRHLTQAVEASRAAVASLATERRARRRAAWRYNHAIGLSLLGELQKRPELLEEALDALRPAAAEPEAELTSRLRCDIDTLRGKALIDLAKLESRPERLTQAIRLLSHASAIVQPKESMLNQGRATLQLGNAERELAAFQQRAPCSAIIHHLRAPHPFHGYRSAAGH